MLVDKAQEALGSAPDRAPGPDRLVAATRQVVRVVTPRNLDDELPGKRVAHGFNIGLTPVLFAAIGYGIDRAAGTLPVFTIALTILCVIGMMARFYYSYQATIDAEVAQAAGQRRQPAKGRRSRR